MKSHESTQEELEQIDINDWIKNHEVHKDRLTPAIIITAVVICSGLLTLSFAGFLIRELTSGNRKIPQTSYPFLIPAKIDRLRCEDAERTLLLK